MTKPKFEIRKLDEKRSVIEKRLKIVGTDKNGKIMSYYVWLFFFLEKNKTKKDKRK
ncbi:MAG: hypothetical protein M1538_02720 [Candidatus Marsarchaeota archaeon]|nr:hypothetical protein [Candidatus Marsarchaeota archaeon]